MYAIESARLWLLVVGVGRLLIQRVVQMVNRTQEQRILVVMRKVLAQIVKDTTPGPGMRHPLREQTIKDIRDCFGLIATRERELAKEAGIEILERPHFVDEPQASKVIRFKPTPKKPQKDE